MKIGIVGLGLIGGSLAKAARAFTPHTVYGLDAAPAVQQAALAAGVLHGTLTPQTLAQCDVVALALFPRQAVAWLESHAKALAGGAVVFDCCGVKSEVCAAGFAAAARHDFVFFGGHPMAGTEHSGWAAADAQLFAGAPMLLVAPQATEVDPLPKSAAARQAAARLEELFRALGFARTVFTTPQVHDAVIAYTSQLAHVVSSAYIKSPTALRHDGYSAGSYRDLTRVAYLNEDMWTELFLANRAPLLCELDRLLQALGEYRAAIGDGDAARLRALLAQGRLCKQRADADTL